jgi:hypothetical protein
MTPIHAGMRIHALIQKGREYEQCLVDQRAPPRPSLAAQLGETQLDASAQDIIVSMERRIRKLEFEQGRTRRRTTRLSEVNGGVVSRQQTPARGNTPNEVLEIAAPAAPPPPPPPMPTPNNSVAQRNKPLSRPPQGIVRPPDIPGPAPFNIAALTQAQRGLRPATLPNPAQRSTPAQSSSRPLVTVHDLKGATLRSVRRSPRLTKRSPNLPALDLRAGLKRVAQKRSPGGTPQRPKLRGELTPLHRAVQQKFKVANSPDHVTSPNSSPAS